MSKLASWVFVAVATVVMSGSPALAQGFLDKLKNMVQPSSQGSDWELYVKTDDLTDKKTQIALNRYVIEDVVFETTFECEVKIVVFKVTMLDSNGQPYGSFDKGDRRSVLVDYRLDEKPASATLMTSRYANSLFLFLGVQPNLGDLIRPEDLLQAERFRIRMPVSSLNNPTLDMDLRSQAVTEVVAGCGM